MTKVIALHLVLLPVSARSRGIAGLGAPLQASCVPLRYALVGKICARHTEPANRGPPAPWEARVLHAATGRCHDCRIPPVTASCLGMPACCSSDCPLPPTW